MSGGKVFSYLAGTTTPAATYTSNTGVTQQQNPIILNSLGLPAQPVWMIGGLPLKFVFQDANGVQTRPTVDNISGIGDSTFEGTFTPIIAGTTVTGLGTYTAQNGRYTKINRLVYVEIDITITAHTGTGNLLIGILPFGSNAAASPLPNIVTLVSNLSLTAGNIAIAQVRSNDNYFAMYQMPSGGGTVTSVPIDPTCTIQLSGFYTAVS